MFTIYLNVKFNIKGDLSLAILRECTGKPSCEVEINLQLVTDESVDFEIHFRSGNSFPEIHSKLACLKRDFIRLLEDIKQIDNINLKILDFHDPGLCIYHIPEHERYDNEPRYKLIFVIDAGEKNHFISTDCGPALCLIVSMEQINEFANSLELELNNF